MKGYRGAVVIDRPPADVFAFLADLTHDPAWRDDVARSELVGGVAGESGARYRQSGPNPKRPGTHHIETPLVDRQRHRISFVTVDASPVAVRGTYEVEARDGGANVVFDIELHPGGVVRLFEPFMGGAVRKTTERYLAALKTHLEHPDGAVR